MIVNGYEVLNKVSGNNKTKRPCLMNYNALLEPVDSSKNKISHILGEVDNGTSSQITNEGFFVLAVASFETMILDILRYYLRWFPEKLSKDKYSIIKDDLLHRPRTLVENLIDKELNEEFYKNIKSILEYFKNTLSLDQSICSDDQQEQLIEIKATRNLLLHNNLIVNNIYIEKAGLKIRTKELGKKLEIDTEYLKTTLALLNAICDVVLNAVTTKYMLYTKIAAIKRLWKYLFNSSVMAFDDYWKVDSDKDRVVSYKGSKYEDEGFLSNSEMMFLKIWRTHFHGYAVNLDNFSMYSLDTEHQSKMLFFLSILDDFRLE